MQYKTYIQYAYTNIHRPYLVAANKQIVRKIINIMIAPLIDPLNKSNKHVSIDEESASLKLAIQNAKKTLVMTSNINNKDENY